MTQAMRASVLFEPRKMEVREMPCPEPAPSEVLIEPYAVGLCGTDFHIYSGEANYHCDAKGAPIPLARAPQVLGHEVAGVVVEAGPGIGDLRAGDRVIVDQGRNCVSQGRAGLCEYCASGDTHQCEHYMEHGITGLQGGLADYLAIPAANAVRIESDLPFVQAAITEPLGCVLHACEAVERAVARYSIGAEETERAVRSVLIAGGGPAGLLFVQVLRSVLGYEGRILLSDRHPHKRALAERFGAETLDPGAGDLVEAVLQRTDGRRADYLIEASGSGPLFEQIPGLIRKQATVLLYGHGHAGASLELLNAVQFREPVLVAPCGASGGFDEDGRPATYRRALRLVEEGTVEAAALVTHEFPGLDHVPDAFTGQERGGAYVKGVAVLRS